MNHRETLYQLQIARTLWHNTYRGKITNENGEYIATIRVILGIPLERSEVPDNAPEVPEWSAVKPAGRGLEATGCPIKPGYAC